MRSNTLYINRHILHIESTLSFLKGALSSHRHFRSHLFNLVSEHFALMLECQEWLEIPVSLTESPDALETFY